jgi:hypothetical protein
MIRLHMITTCLAFLTSVIACQDKGASGLESLRTTSGVPLYALSAGHDTVVLAIYDPADCLGHLDTIQPPRRLRRGVSTQALRKYFVKRRFRYDLALGSISVTDGLWRRPNGQLVLVHMDSRAYMKEGRLVGVSATPFVSLLTPDLARACVDGLIEAPEAARPAVAILGDTLYVVDQRTKAGGSSSETVLRRFLIDESTCSWVSIDRSEG